MTTTNQSSDTPETEVETIDAEVEPEASREVSSDATGAGLGEEPSDGTASEEAPEAEEDPLAAAEAEAARYKDQLLRTAADFDNYRKRSRREAEEAERRGRDELLRELLPVFDNLERASSHAASASDVKALADGIEMVMRQFLDTLGRLGVERILAVGAAFDPTVHEAIQQIETSDFEPGQVAQEVQAGYRTKDRLIRPSMVVVAKRPADTDN